MRSSLVRRINNFTKTLSLRAKVPNTYGALMAYIKRALYLGAIAGVSQRYTTKWAYHKVSMPQSRHTKMLAHHKMSIPQSGHTTKWTYQKVSPPQVGIPQSGHTTK